MDFLSCESINLHKEYLRKLKLKYSVFEVSHPEIKDAVYREVARLRLDKLEKKEIINLKSEIEAHEIFFKSFIANGEKCERNEFISRSFGSEANFLFEILQYAKDKNGFLLLYFDKGGRIKKYCGDDYSRIMFYYDCVLSVDLCEHAYFMDFGFDKERYLSYALSNLKLSKLNKQKYIAK